MTAHRYVDSLPDLIDPSQYEQHPAGQLVHVRITVTEDGVEVLGDAMRPEVIEALLATLDPAEIEQMLCG
ncbi:hypothetical protein Rhe02_91270 [Rhizocola hellebori]|uniref:Uncharacterized protein n=1 Tax=Rhizocola hellebori TaxID=1392758 RepID=A0A8J3QJU8_9ACTN|nr:radical SAM-modified peptide, FtsH ternary system-associated [Rhizocola hellebori]GIH11060.1 hypothetical protein Rhe02_91270 [Rhizocola hellebori]